MRTCYDCGNAPEPPNFLNQYVDDDGDPYAQCDRCIDFDADTDEAEDDEAFVNWLGCQGYEIWRSAWAETETPEERNAKVRTAYEQWQKGTGEAE